MRGAVEGGLTNRPVAAVPPYISTHDGPRCVKGRGGSSSGGVRVGRWLAVGPRTRRSSTLNWCTTSRTAGPHGDPCQRIGKQAYEHLLLCGRFFQRNGAIGRLELSTTSSLCRRSTPMERGCATRRWANAAERGAPNAEPGARGGDQPRRRRPGAQRPRHRRRTRSARRRWQPGPASS